MTVDLAARVRDIADFPSAGVVFKDITPLLADAVALDAAIQGLAAPVRDLGIDCVIGAEARGFLLGTALAHTLGAGFVLARKPGKLPYDTVRAEYLLEYGTDALEVHTDALSHGARVLVHDDLLAAFSFLIELAFLDGRTRLGDHDVHALLRYDAEGPAS